MTEENQTFEQTLWEKRDDIGYPVAALLTGFLGHRVVSHYNIVATKGLMRDAGFKPTCNGRYPTFAVKSVHPTDMNLVKQYLRYSRMGWWTMAGAMMVQQEKYDTFPEIDENAKFGNRKNENSQMIEALGIMGMLSGCVRNATYSSRLLKNIGDTTHMNQVKRSISTYGVMFRGGMLGITSLLMFNFLLG